MISSDPLAIVAKQDTAAEYEASPPRNTLVGSVRHSLPEAPDLRSKQYVDIHYLPPLLSRLPGQVDAHSPAIETYDFDRPTVRYTTTHLPRIDFASTCLHHALHAFRPVSPDYAHAPYEQAFNWTELRLPHEVERSWYVIAFRSQRAPGTPSVDLYEADRAAHEEAVATGGLLMYWYGVATPGGANLATCIWRTRAAAVAAVQGPKHREAMLLASCMYEHFRIERWVLHKASGQDRLSLRAWQDGEDVGF